MRPRQLYRKLSTFYNTMIPNVSQHVAHEDTIHAVPFSLSITTMIFFHIKAFTAYGQMRKLEKKHMFHCSSETGTMVIGTYMLSCTA